MEGHAAHPAARAPAFGLRAGVAAPGPRVAPSRSAHRGLRVLFLVSAHNSLSQRVQIALEEHGHEVDVAVVASPGSMEAAVDRHRPELIVCPMLKSIIPESIFAAHRCLIVHPGPVGDRGPSSLDWAIELGAAEWGVTVLEATATVDGGDVWATRTFAIARDGEEQPLPSRGPPRGGRGRRAGGHPDRRGEHRAGAARPRRPAGDRSAAPAAHAGRAGDRLGLRPTATVVRRINAAEGHPGVLDAIRGVPFHLFGAHAERRLRGAPGRAGGAARTVPCAARPSTAPCGSRTCKAPGVVQAPRRAGARGRRRRARRAGGPGSAPRLPAGRATRSARSPTTSATASATCPSTSTTAP